MKKWAPQVTAEDNGLEVLDLADYHAFAARKPRSRDLNRRSIGMDRLAVAMVYEPDKILQVLVDTAVELCEADSAGISIERIGPDGVLHYHWVATAGIYKQYLDAMLPDSPSACGTCLHRGTPQHLRVTERFFQLLHIEAAIVTDGLLLPWQAGDVRGTIWILAHGRDEAFDQSDLDILTVFANFAALGTVQQQRQKVQYKFWASTAAAAVTDALAQRVDNPLRELSGLIAAAANGPTGGDSKLLAKNLQDPLRTLTALLEELVGRPVPQRPN